MNLQSAPTYTRMAFGTEDKHEKSNERKLHKTIIWNVLELGRGQTDGLINVLTHIIFDWAFALSVNVWNLVIICHTQMWYANARGQGKSADYIEQHQNAIRTHKISTKPSVKINSDQTKRPSLLYVVFIFHKTTICMRVSSLEC